MKLEICKGRWMKIWNLVNKGQDRFGNGKFLCPVIACYPGDVIWNTYSLVRYGEKCYAIVRGNVVKNVERLTAENIYRKTMEDMEARNDQRDI